MGTRKEWKDTQTARINDLLGLLDDQTRGAAVEQHWDLGRAAVQIDVILGADTKLFNLARSAYLFDIDNPTSLQLSQKWALVWEQVRKFRPDPMRRQKPRTALRLPGWRRASVRAYRATVGAQYVAGITGAGYLAVTQPPELFWPGAVIVSLIYAGLNAMRIRSRQIKSSDITERDWVAITKAVAHQRFNRIKPATLDVGIEHRSGMEDTADAIAALRPPMPADLRPDPARLFHRRRHMESNSRAAAGLPPQGKSMAKRTEFATRLAEFADQSADDTALDTSTAPPKPDVGDADHARRVAGVHAALARLDEEWLEYESDWHAWSLAKPLLHVPDVPQTAAYNDALYDLREITYTLADTASVTDIVAAEKAADAALSAWDIAQDHAAAIGIADRSPLEQRTLRRLHHLVGQLADPSTPKPMWQGLITQIDRQLKNLETVPITWSHIQHLSALEASPRIQAIQQFAEVPHA